MSALANSDPRPNSTVSEPSPTPLLRNAALSLRRGIRFLALVAEYTKRGEKLTLGDVAEHLDISRSSALRLSVPLVEHGLIRRVDHGFRLGVGALDLGQSYLDGIDLRTVAAPFLRRAAERTGQTCHLVIPQDREVVYIDKVELEATPRMGSRIGGKMPMHRTAVGRAILSSSDPARMIDIADAVDWTLDGGSAEKARAEFTAEIVRTRMRGYGIDDCENEETVRCVGAAIFDHTNTVIGAVSISSLRHRMPQPLMRERGVYVMRLGLQISEALGSGAASLRLARLDRQSTASDAQK